MDSVNGILGLAGLVLAVVLYLLGRRQGRMAIERAIGKEKELEIHLQRDQEVFSIENWSPARPEAMSLKWNGKKANNLVKLKLTFRLSSLADLNNDEARKAGEGGPQSPRIWFKNFRIFYVQTESGARRVADIRLAVTRKGRAVFLNVVRLRRNASASYWLLGTKPQEKKEIAAIFEHGRFVDTRVTPSGFSEVLALGSRAPGRGL